MCNIYISIFTTCVFITIAYNGILCNLGNMFKYVFFVLFCFLLVDNTFGLYNALYLAFPERHKTELYRDDERQPRSGQAIRWEQKAFQAGGAASSWSCRGGDLFLRRAWV